jgi:hypothetical protein
MVDIPSLQEALQCIRTIETEHNVNDEPRNGTLRLLRHDIEREIGDMLEELAAGNYGPQRTSRSSWAQRNHYHLLLEPIVEQCEYSGGENR